MARLLVSFLALLAILLGGAQGTIWTVQMYGEGVSTGLVAFWFYPTTITINKGDTIFFQWGANTPGIVSIGNNQPGLFATDPATGRFAFNNAFYNPTANTIANPDTLYSSGFMVPSGPVYPAWNATFTGVGTFAVANPLHVPGMTMTVIVQATGSYPQTQADMTAAAQAMIADQNNCFGNAVKFYNLNRTTPYGTPHPNGINTIWSIWTAYGDFWNFFSVARFFPNAITVKQGDVLVFNNADTDLHIVALGVESSMPPLFQYDPVLDMTYLYQTFVAGIPGPFTGTGYVSSGLMIPSIAPGSTSYSWNVTLNAVGNFALICALHEPFGMVATLTVTN